MWSRKHNAEHVWRNGTLASSTARAGTSWEMIQQKTRSTSNPCWISSLSRTFTSGRADHTRSQVREERRLQRIPHGKSTPKEMSKETIQEHSQSIYPWWMVQKDYARIGSLWRSNPWDGQTCERRPHPYCHRRRTWRISWQLVDPFELCGFRHDAGEASTWLQESAVYIASPQESGG